ncbi:MAG: hypothetical protein AAF674_19770 [Pseudomonadota bacterium]
MRVPWTQSKKTNSPVASTILEIAREAANRDNTAPPPATLFGTNDRIAEALRVAANDVFRTYLRHTRWEGLSELHSTFVWALQPGKYAYPLPPDFLRTIPRTEQRNGWPLGLLGPATPEYWANWVFGLDAISATMGWRIRNNAIFIEPIPQSAELVAIEYISRYPVVSEIRTGDYDLTRTPIQTIAPIVARDGWLNTVNDDVFQSALATVANFGQQPGFDISVWAQDPWEILRFVQPTSAVAPLPQVRRPEFTADADMPAFDDNHVLSLGMTFHLQRALGLPYAERAAEFESEMEVKASTDAGKGAGFRLQQGDRPDWDVWPLGNGDWMVR